MSALQVHLPVEFTREHEQVVIDYLAGRLRGQAVWRLAFEAFDLLDTALLVTPDYQRTFRELYQEVVDREMADDYLRELLALPNVHEQSPALWARFAHQIVNEFNRRNWRQMDMPETRLLLSYLLYWWGAFSRGYALEVEVFRDLEHSGVRFQAHNLLDRRQRYSPSDLTIAGLAGDIKTSLYFVQVAVPLKHDFYIVRLYVEGRVYTLVVLLKPAAWDEINGDTLEGQLQSVVAQPSKPVKIQQAGHELVALDYQEWKRRILGLQGESI